MTRGQWLRLSEILRVICTCLAILLVIVSIGAWFTIDCVTAAIISAACAYVVRATFQMCFD